MIGVSIYAVDNPSLPRVTDRERPLAIVGSVSTSKVSGP